ncbi:MAG TPA: 50S ribosomal protein L21 [Candidatus Portnoybacteria bacterium]|nr:50S ribosomal protein L21 [Candidatus Portnoybacteria bacterium]
MNIAVIKTGGKQYIVASGQKIRIEKIDGQEGGKVSFGEVLLLASGDKVQIGQPVVEGAKVSGKILKQDRADKVIVFKYKSKKRYKVKRGHRQPYTEVQIESIK